MGKEMDHMRKVIGQRIKEARLRLALSQEDLAKKIGWREHVKVSTVERGEREVKAWELAKMARVLNVDLTYLLGSALEEETVPYVLWRNRPPHYQDHEAKFLHQSSDYALVERLLKMERRERTFPHLDLGQKLNQATEQKVYRMASTVRGQMGLGRFPAKTLVQTLEDVYGVKFISAEGSSGGSAATSISAKLGPCILLNPEEVAWRQHFSIAHEVFHIVTWDEVLFKKVGTDKDLCRRYEYLADCFAAGLLLPAEVLEEEVGKVLAGASGINQLSYADIIALARQFEVSAEALIYRMANLGMISRKKAQAINADPEFIKLNTKSNRNRKHTLQLSDRFLRLAYRPT